MPITPQAEARAEAEQAKAEAEAKLQAAAQWGKPAAQEGKPAEEELEEEATPTPTQQPGARPPRGERKAQSANANASHPLQ